MILDRTVRPWTTKNCLAHIRFPESKPSVFRRVSVSGLGAASSRSSSISALASPQVETLEVCVWGGGVIGNMNPYKKPKTRG